jgi:type II secretion system protein H
MKRRAGFTLLEVTVVMVIVLLLSALAIPRMGGTLAEARLKQSARDVTGLLRFARDYCVVTEGTCEVRIDPDRDAYQFVAFDEEGRRVEPRNSRRPDERQRMAMGDDVSDVRQLPKDVHFARIYSEAPLTEDTKLARVMYYPDGSATPATIAIQDDKQRAITVQVFRTTGMARVTVGMPLDLPTETKLYYGPKNQ